MAKKKLCLLGLFVFIAQSSVDCDGSLSFMVIGDWGGLPFFPYRTPVETAVAKKLSQHAQSINAQFILALGDNFYFDGVKNVEDPRFQETYNHIYDYPSLDIDWYLVAGNHDHNGNVTAQIEYSQKEKRWKFPDFYYNVSFTIPGTTSTIDIVMIDTVVLCGNSDADYLYRQPKGPEDISFAEEQWKWIKDKITSSKADYLLVAGHYPVYSIAEHGPTPLLVDRLMPLLHQHSVTAYLSGHDHNLQHLQVTNFSHTVDYFVSGAANFVEDSKANKNSVPKDSSKFFWADLLSLGGFAEVTATPDNMTLTFVGANGKYLYNRTMLPRRHSHP